LTVANNATIDSIDSLMSGGRGSVYPAAATDAIDHVIPRWIVEPASAEALAEVLAWASAERVSTVLRGGGTKLGWGRIPNEIDLVVSTRQLNRVLTHAYGDLTVTVQAGAPVLDVNRELRRHAQWLPIDVVSDSATIGGAIATNDSGPLRQRHGTPRDLLIGVQLATTDGRIVKAGGQVVKNVAGYDLGKLVSGSFGGLAAIVSATFKLAPIPSASATLAASFETPGELAQTAAAIGGSQLEPSGLEVHALFGSGRERANGFRLLIQFASAQPAVDAQIDQVRRLLDAGAVDQIIGDSERDAWNVHTHGLWERDGIIVKASWLPNNLAAVLAMLAEIAGRGIGGAEMIGRAAVGAGLIRIDAEPASAIAAIAALRARPEVLGHVVILRAVSDVKRGVDVWGPAGDRAALVGAVKRAFDPQGILNAGRGPV
jgi:glycolate oxidase FAD binding subunit